MNLQAQIEGVIKPIVLSFGLEFVGIEMIHSSPLVLRVYIDQEGGVVIDKCSGVSRQISSSLDVENLISAKYLLEVSSPGIDRPLFRIADFEKFVSKQVVVKLHSSIEGRKKIIGTIKSVDGNQITLAEDAGGNTTDCVIPFDQVKKANLRILI